MILQRIFSQFGDSKKKIIIPDPEGSMAADLIAECLPRSKIILLIRDGRDAVDSRISSLHKDGWYVKNEGVTPLKTNRLPKIIWLSKKWVKQMEILSKAYFDHSENLRFKIKYEDLRLETKKHLKKIYDFIGIEITSEKLNEVVEKYDFKKLGKDQKGSFKVKRAAKPGSWKSDFNEKEKKKVAETVKNIMENCYKLDVPLVVELKSGKNWGQMKSIKKS